VSIECPIIPFKQCFEILSGTRINVLSSTGNNPMLIDEQLPNLTTINPSFNYGGLRKLPAL
jgi:hypothetical protein